MVGGSHDLASALAHELESPLLSLELRLRTGLSEGPTLDTVKACLEEVAALRALVHDFLALAPENVRREPFALAPLLDSLARTYGPIAAARRISLELPSFEGEARGDDRATSRILSNLLDNALKFSPESSRVLLRVRETDETIAFDVEDQGGGIPESERARIFEPFVRLDREAGGTGLGLSLALALARAQGATLELASVSEGGSCFTLSLPRK